MGERPVNLVNPAVWDAVEPSGHGKRAGVKTGYVLGLDIGASTLHCILADGENRVAAEAHAPLGCYCPEGAPPLAREFHPGKTWEELARLARRVCRRAGAAPSDVAAIGVTGQGQGMALVGRDGAELYCGPNIDLRAVFEGAAIDGEAGGEIYRAAGHFPSLLMAPAKLRWFQVHQPGRIAEAATLLSVPGWLAWRLTGRAAASAGLNCGLGIAALDDGGKIASLLQRAGFPEGLTPPIVEAGEAIAGLAPAAAGELGLEAGIPVTLADADNLSGLVGMGLTAPGEAGALLGWSGSVQILTAGPRLDGADGPRVWADPYPIGGLYTVQANLGDAGRGYSWLLHVIAAPGGAAGIGGRRMSYADAEAAARRVPAGSGGLAAYLGPGPVTAPGAGLRLGGIVMPTPLTFQEPGPGQIVRSYLESVAYSVKANLDTAAEVSGHSPAGVRLGGSLSRSDIIAETMAALLEIPVHRSANPQASALGATAAAWTAAGRYPSLSEAAEAQSQDFQTFHPDAARSAEYREHYRRWREIYQRLNSGPA